MQWERWLTTAGYRPEDGYRITEKMPSCSPVPVVVIGPELEMVRIEAKERFGSDYLVHAVVGGCVTKRALGEIVGAEAMVFPPVIADVREVSRLLSVMEVLRSAEGCPWDRKQTHTSLRRYLIEEAYEVAEAIDTKDMDLLCEELGDVLLQVVFHSRIAEEQGIFNFFTICREISNKMISRHPHVFDKARKIRDIDVVDMWEVRKNKEKNRKNLLEGVFWGLPSLLFACKIQEKTARIGFDWDSMEPVWEKLNEEWEEVHQAIADGNPESLEEECGDVLFATVNVLRHLGIEPETALRKTNEKFCRRFQYVESCVRESGKDWNAVSLQQMDMYWEEAKRQERE